MKKTDLEELADAIEGKSGIHTEMFINVDALRAAVGLLNRLPVTADGVLTDYEKVIYVINREGNLATDYPHWDGVEAHGFSTKIPVSQSYSTHEAAVAALATQREMMAMPDLQNCPHSPDGWCLNCVSRLHGQAEATRKALADLYKFFPLYEWEARAEFGPRTDAKGEPDMPECYDTIYERLMNAASAALAEADGRGR